LTGFFRCLTCVLSLVQRPLLTPCSKKALAIDTDAAVPAISHDITNAHTTVPGTQNDVVNTIPIVPDGHSNASKIPEDARGWGQLVSTIHTCHRVKIHPRLDSRQVSDLC